MASAAGKDRRKYHRIDTDQVISFSEAREAHRLAVGKDLSLGGIRFEAVGCEISEGEILRVTFNVGDETVAVVGVVAWATEIDALSLDVGLEFVEVEPNALRLLHEVLEVGQDH